MSRELDRVGGDLPSVRSEVVSGEVGECRMRLAGIIENAVEVRVVRIDKRKVTLLIRMGDDEAKEYSLGAGDGFQGHLNVKSASVGLF